jgi:hypothetical protein
MSWPRLLREILLELDFGWYAFEKVFDIYDGKVVWRKIAPRHPALLEEWIYDSNGGPNGARFFRQFSNQSASVFIPIEKLLVFTHEQEGGNMEGISVLRPAYKHWYYIDNLYKIDAIQKERHGIGVPVIKLPPNFSTNDKSAADNLGANLRTNERAHVVLPPMWDIMMLKMEGNPVDSLASAQHHGKMMYESILAGFMIGEGAKDGQAMFEKSCRFVADEIRDVFNKWAIPELVAYNWKTVDKFPELKVRRLGDTVDWRTISFAIRNFVGAGVIIPDDASESIPKTFLEQLNRIQYHIHEYQKAGIETPNIEHVKKLAKKTFLEYPVFFFNKKYINIVEELFTEEERSTFVQNQLDKTPVNVDLLLTVLFSEQFSTYKTQLHALLIKDEKLFLKVFEERYIFSTGVISLSEMVTFIINNLGTVSLAINFDATFIQPLLEDEEELERLLAAFVKANDAPNLALLINVIRSIEHLSYNIPANWRKEIKKTEEALEIRLRDRRQSSHDDLGFVEIEKDIEDLRDTLDRLKKTKPDEEKVWQTHTVAKERKHTLVTGLRNLCEQEKFAVFDEDVMCALGESAKDFILRDIEEYVSLYPNILLTHTSNKLRNGFPNSEGLFFRKILGDELFIKLFSSTLI